MLAMYEQMRLIRAFDRKSILMQRQGRMGTYAPFEGQEAAQVGSAMALSERDWMYPSYRDHGASVTFGQRMMRVMLYWMGHMEGSLAPDGKRIMPPCVPIATHLLHAVGTAWASKLKGEADVTIAYFGEGATSEGDFHEAMNFAGVFQTPIVFFCQNNGYAISVPFSRQSASRTIAQRAAAYDIPGTLVDGNDVFAVWLTVREAIERAREGGGPALIEAVTYRYGAHTTADDPKKYRDSSKAKEWREQRDPIERLRLYLMKRDLWNDQVEEQLEQRIAGLVEQDVMEAEAYIKSQATDMFQHVYGDSTWLLEEQEREARMYMQRQIEGRGGVLV